MRLLDTKVIDLHLKGKGMEEIAKTTELPLDEIKELIDLYEGN